MTLKLQWPLKLQKALTPTIKRRTYSGAQMGRLVADFVSMATSGDAEIRMNMRILRNRSRQLERDNDYVKNYLREVESNVIGMGIGFEGQVKMQRGDKLNEPVNQAIQDAWTEWCDKDCCHVAGKLSFTDIENLVARSVFRDGEILIRKVTQNLVSRGFLWL
jgi:capsid protein